MGQLLAHHCVQLVLNAGFFTPERQYTQNEIQLPNLMNVQMLQIVQDVLKVDLGSI